MNGGTPFGCLSTGSRAAHAEATTHKNGTQIYLIDLICLI
jgi:hypothetical protein